MRFLLKYIINILSFLFQIRISHVKVQKGFIDCALILGCPCLKLFIFGYLSWRGMIFVIVVHILVVLFF